MSRTVGTLLVSLAVGLVSCAAPAGEPPGSEPIAGPPPAAPVMPASAIPRMTSTMSDVGLGAITAEVVHPDELSSVLTEAGFVAARQRSFSGGTGVFTRVVARGMRFESEAGARAFVSWFGERAGEEMLTAERITPTTVGDDVVVFRHRPDGCCHNDVPVFFAGWASDSSVLYLYAGGRRANAPAFLRLLASYDSEA